MSDSDEIIEQLFVDVSEFIIDELEYDTHEKILKLVEKKFQRKKRYIQRCREEGHNRLVADYFLDQPVLPPYLFRRRFCMNKELFIQIVNSLSNHSDYFNLRKDATGNQGLSVLQKCTAPIRQLAYGTAADQNDKYVRIGESTSIEYLKNFCRVVIEVLGPTYLRRPNEEYVARVLHLHEEHHGFPDINVLNQSTLFNDVLQGYSPDVKFNVNGMEYTKGYYLADGIYPEWATIVKSFSCPQDLKRKKFKEMQEAARKDMEQTFRVLQSRWAIIRGAARFWMDTTMSDIIYACIIMHNMIVENEGNAISHWLDEDGDPQYALEMDLLVH